MQSSQEGDGHCVTRLENQISLGTNATQAMPRARIEGAEGFVVEGRRGYVIALVLAVMSHVKMHAGSSWSVTWAALAANTDRLPWRRLCRFRLQSF